MKKGVFALLFMLVNLSGGFGQEVFENFTFEVQKASDSMYVVSLVDLDTKDKTDRLLRYPPTSPDKTREILNAVKEKKLAKIGVAKYLYLRAMIDYELTEEKIDTLGVRNYTEYSKKVLRPLFDGHWLLTSNEEGSEAKVLELKAGEVFMKGEKVGSVGVASTREVVLEYDDKKLNLYSENGSFFLAKKGDSIYSLVKVKKQKEDAGEEE